jgi:hypothetical protein
VAAKLKPWREVVTPQHQIVLIDSHQTALSSYDPRNEEDAETINPRTGNNQPNRVRIIPGSRPPGRPNASLRFHFGGFIPAASVIVNDPTLLH